jgi:hypothetical protein
MTTKKTKSNVKQVKVAKKAKAAELPLSYLLGAAGVVLLLVIGITSIVSKPRSAGLVPLATMTQLPTATPAVFFTTATPFLPFVDMISSPAVQYFVMTQLEITNRNGKLVSVRDTPGMYYPNTSTPSKVIGWLAPGTSWYVEQAYKIGADVWARLASQDGFIPLFYNDTYFTNWRKP